MNVEIDKSRADVAAVGIDDLGSLGNILLVYKGENSVGKEKRLSALNSILNNKFSVFDS